MENKVKEDCFAYKNGECRSLNELFCKKEKCKFYKSKDVVKFEQLDREARKYANNSR